MLTIQDAVRANVDEGAALLWIASKALPGFKPGGYQESPRQPG